MQQQNTNKHYAINDNDIYFILSFHFLVKLVSQISRIYRPFRDPNTEETIKSQLQIAKKIQTFTKTPGKRQINIKIIDVSNIL